MKKKKITFFKLSLEFLFKSDGEFQKLEITINLIFWKYQMCFRFKKKSLFALYLLNIWEQ